MIKKTEYVGSPMCDGCGKYFDEVYLMVMGDYFNQIWSYVFCAECVMSIHMSYQYVQGNPSRSMNVFVRGRNINVNDILIWGDPITRDNLHRFPMPDDAIIM